MQRGERVHPRAETTLTCTTVTCNKPVRSMALTMLSALLEQQLRCVACSFVQLPCQEPIGGIWAANKADSSRLACIYYPTL